ncbi:MAG: alternate-type signal peptide domain-containing protein [Nocardioidaceae bacterium]|nr:alternate-type signal peptide domain-containing protein [Nocardioidaceae bacterium]
MKKSTKGAIAAGAAAVLLVGGAGSLAFWSDSEGVDGGTITSGRLTITPAGTPAPTWTDETTGTAIPDIGAFRIVPGDSLTYTADFVVEAVGDNLAATIEVDDDSITGSPTLLAETTQSVQVLDGGAALTAITEAQDGDTVTAEVTFTFPYAAATNASQSTTAALQTVDLTGLTLDLNQSGPQTAP